MNQTAPHVGLPPQIEAYSPLEEITSRPGVVVLRGVAPESGGPVAVKIFGEVAGHQDGGEPWERLLNALRALEDVTHPSLPRVLEVGRVGAGTVYCVSEWIRGHAVRAPLAVNGRVALRYSLQTAEALEALARSGQAHLNLSAQNLMVDDGGRIVLTGQGTGHLPGLLVRRDGQAPELEELLEGEGPLWGCDLFALGLLTCSLLGADVGGLGSEAPVVGLPESCSELPGPAGRLKEVLESTLHEAPARRPASFEEFRRGLHDALGIAAEEDAATSRQPPLDDPDTCGELQASGSVLVFAASVPEPEQATPSAAGDDAFLIDTTARHEEVSNRFASIASRSEDPQAPGEVMARLDAEDSGSEPKRVSSMSSVILSGPDLVPQELRDEGIESPLPDGAAGPEPRLPRQTTSGGEAAASPPPLDFSIVESEPTETVSGDDGDGMDGATRPSGRGASMLAEALGDRPIQSPALYLARPSAGSEATSRDQSSDVAPGRGEAESRVEDTQPVALAEAPEIGIEDLFSGDAQERAEPAATLSETGSPGGVSAAAATDPVDLDPQTFDPSPLASPSPSPSAERSAQPAAPKRTYGAAHVRSRGPGKKLVWGLLMVAAVVWTVLGVLWLSSRSRQADEPIEAGVMAARAARPPSTSSEASAAAASDRSSSLPLDPEASASAHETATPATAPPPVASAVAPVEAIAEAVSLWARAWSSQDVEGYLSAYAPSFRPANGASRTQWERGRRERVAAPQRIDVQVTGLEVELETSRTARVVFSQRYESDTMADRVRKTLQLVRDGERWLIERESSTPLPL